MLLCMAHPRKDPKKAVAVIRTSTDRQENSVEVQSVAIDDYAYKRGIEVVVMYAEVGVSGTSKLEKRLGLLDALAALDELGAGLLIFAEPSRLSRDSLVARVIEDVVARKGARLVMAQGPEGGTSPSDKLISSILNAVSQHENDIRRQRVKAALALKKTKNERTGNVPYGFSLAANGVDLLPDPREQAIIAKMLEWRAEGATIQDVTDQLNYETLSPEGDRAAFAPRNGKCWHKTQVARLLKRGLPRERGAA
jgi:site-specific DNA recombinase